MTINRKRTNKRPKTDVARLLGIDLRNIQLIFAAIALLEPDYDFTMVAKE